MHPLTYVGASIAIIGAACAGGWLLRGRQALARSEAAPTAALSAEVQEVERELRALRREKELGRTATAEPRPAEPAKSVGPNTAKGNDRARMTDAQHNELISARLDQQFDADGVDPSWSERTEREISNAVSESLPHSKLEELRCRSSICRMSFTHPNAEASEAFSGTLSQMRAFASEAVIRNVGTETEPRSVVYLARAGHKLNMPED